MEWKQRFYIINKIMSERLAAQGQNLTYDTAASFLETSTATYGRWKAGKKVPDGDELERIAKKLGISAHWLLTGEGEPTGQPPAQTSEKSNVAELKVCVAELEAEVSRLRQRLLDSQDEIDALKNKIIALYEQQQGGQHDVFTLRRGNARTGDTVAPSAHTDSKIER
jgi:transcriptional regulator with XRE-family HTH domain